MEELISVKILDVSSEFKVWCLFQICYEELVLYWILYNENH